MLWTYSYHRILATLVGIAGIGTAIAIAQTDGQWADVADMKLTTGTMHAAALPNPMMAQHAILLHTGKVLCIDFRQSHPDADEPDTPDVVLFTPPTDINNPGSAVVEYVWDDGTEATVWPFDHFLSCVGHCQLSDGRILLRGGGPFLAHGNIETTIFDPTKPIGDADRFVEGPDENWALDPGGTPMDHKRFYPTLTGWATATCWPPTAGTGATTMLTDWPTCRSC